MGVLEVPGAFEVVLPDGWTAISDGGTYFEVRPRGDQSVEINISILRKPSKGTKSESAARRFATQIGVASPERLTILTPRQLGQQRSFVKAEAQGLHWFIGCLFFKRCYVLASANTANSENQNFKLAEAVIASIAPNNRRSTSALSKGRPV